MLYLKKNQMKNLLFLLFTSFCMAQAKPNTVVFAEIMNGYSNGVIKGLSGGATINYQHKKDFFTYRFLEVTEMRKDGSFFFIPVYTNVQIIRENAFMYGRRLVEGNMSYSYGAGISQINREYLIDETNNLLKYENEQFIGLPFEFNVKWFNSTKQKYRIYELIPVGQPTSFANSIGFKFYGSISKRSFVGLGITFGLGWHRVY